MKRIALTSLLSALCALALLASVASAQTTPTITTFSDGRFPTPATSVGLDYPTSVIADPAGNFYIADTNSNTVYRVDNAGTLSVFAGSGICTFAGDGGPARSASLCQPQGLAVDNAGNVLISDTRNNRLRRVDSSGIITTIAGSGNCCSLNDGGPATSAWLFYPYSATTDPSGNLFIADYYNNRVAKVDGSGNISTFIKVSSPLAVTTDASGNLYVAAGDDSTRIVDSSGNQVATITSSSSNWGLVVDGSGNVLASNNYLAQVLKYDSSLNLLGSVAGVAGDRGFNGDGVATTQWLNSPWGLALESGGNLLIADAGNNRIRQVDTSGNMTTLAGSGSYGGFLATPIATAVDASGNVYYADSQSNEVRRISSDGQTATVVAGTGNFGFSGDGPATSNTLAGPQGLAIDGNGNVYVSDTGNARIRKIDSAGNMTTVAGNGSCTFTGDGAATANALCQPMGVTLDGTGNLLIADYGNQRIRKVDTLGNMTTVAGIGSNGFAGDGGPATAAALYFPQSVAVDSNGNLYIADTYNNRIRKVDTNGIINTVAGTGACYISNDGPAVSSALCSPVGLAVTTGGSVLVSDTGNNRVRVLYATGDIKTIAGDAGYGFSGDGGSAYTANLARPEGVAVDAAGDLFIADTANYRIRKVVGAPLTPPATDLSVALSASPTKAAPGTNITYSITVSNIGGNSAGGVTVTDNLDPSLTFVSCSTTGTGACGGTGNNRTVTFSTMAVGESDIVTLVASVNSGATGTINDTATVASISPDSNSANNSASASVSLGTPAATLSATSLTFPNQKVNTTSAGRSFTVRNSGSASLVITGITLGGAHPGEFSYTSGTLPITVAPGTSTSITTKFTPTATGAASATLSIADNASGSPQSVNLSGDGVSASATKLTSSANPAQVGQTVTFTAVVTSATAGTPTGTMTFKDGATTLGSVALDGTGSASLSTSSLAAGTHAISASYSGDNTFAASSGSLKENVGNTTTAAVVSSLNPSAYATAVTFTATVTSAGGTPTGTVAFKAGTTLLASVALSGGQAAFTTSSLAPGARSITAVYTPTSGSGFFGSTSPVLTQTVNKAGTTTTLTTSGSPSTAGTPVTFTATVTSTAGTPAGNVVFKYGTTTLGTVALSGGTASLTTSSLPTGTLTIKATYLATTDYATSTGSVTQAVQ